MDSLMTYFAMGGYALYVWPAYVLCAVVVGGLAGHAWMERRRTLALLEQMRALSRDREPS